MRIQPASQPIASLVDRNDVPRADFDNASQGRGLPLWPCSGASPLLTHRPRRRYRVRALFVKNTTNPRLLERIARESGAAIGGHLYSDALSAPDTEADTYLKLFAHNARTIRAGLQGTRHN